MKNLRPIQILGQLIKNHRQEFDLSHQDIADELGVKAIYIIDLEKNKIKTMSVDMLYPLARVLQISGEDFLKKLELESQEQAFYEDFF